MARTNPTGASKPVRVPETTYRDMDELVESTDGVSSRSELVAALVEEAVRKEERQQGVEVEEVRQPLLAPDPLGVAEALTDGQVRDPLIWGVENGGERQ